MPHKFLPGGERHCEQQPDDSAVEDRLPLRGGRQHGGQPGLRGVGDLRGATVEQAPRHTGETT